MCDLRLDSSCCVPEAIWHYGHVNILDVTTPSLVRWSKSLALSRIQSVDIIFNYHVTFRVMAVAIWTNFLLLFPESELSASTAEMFEVVGQFLKCLGLLSQVSWYYFLNCFEVVIDLSVVKFVFSTKICRRCCQDVHWTSNQCKVRQTCNRNKENRQVQI